MTPKENKEIVQRLLGNLNPETFEALVSPDAVDHELSSGWPPSKTSFKEFFYGFTKGCPDLKASVDDIIAENDKVAARVTFSGTQTGELFQIPPTGKHFSVTGIAFFQLSEGKIVGHWGIMNQVGLMRQLGL